MIISIFPLLMMGILVFPLVRSSPVLVAESNLGCQCFSEASTKVGERADGDVMSWVDIAGEL